MHRKVKLVFNGKRWDEITLPSEALARTLAELLPGKIKSLTGCTLDMDVAVLDVGDECCKVTPQSRCSPQHPDWVHINASLS